ncbi:EAL domain-containing protein, partial [Pseudomonas chlororaphis]|nr:EAL domain-containing protein [Pseudomonas chlororaphis]
MRVLQQALDHAPHHAAVQLAHHLMALEHGEGVDAIAGLLDVAQQTFLVQHPAGVGQPHHRLEGQRELGCRVAVDDFGAGLGTLEFIRQTRPDMVKIDQG